MRASKALGRKTSITVTLDPYEPVILAASPMAFSELEISAPPRLRRGDSALLGLSLARRSPAGAHVFHLDVIDPGGRIIDYYSGNIIASGERAAKRIPIAFNDARGTWTARAKDLLSGQTKSVTIDVE